MHLGSWVADQGARPPRVSVVGAQPADLGAHQPGFRCVLGLLILRSPRPGTEVGGVLEATAAVESSVNSC